MNKLILNFKSKDSKKIKNPKNFLGGKGANLSEMGRIGLPVPPGFTISTKVCELFYKDKKKLNSQIVSTIKKELSEFLMDRLKYYMKEKKIRTDIAEASIKSYGIDHMNKIYKKALTLNNLIKKEIGEDVMASYKRASSILESELKNSDLELSNTTDPGIFKNDYEKNLLKKINELRKYFTNINKDENYVESLTNLAGAKKVIFDFFNNVKVNDEDKSIKKNRLELLQMLCRTFDNYINFSNIETK